MCVFLMVGWFIVLILVQAPPLILIGSRSFSRLNNKILSSKSKLLKPDSKKSGNKKVAPSSKNRPYSKAMQPPSNNKNGESHTLIVSTNSEDSNDDNEKVEVEVKEAKEEKDQVRHTNDGEDWNTGEPEIIKIEELS
jgi:hypothetical protein